LNFRNNNAALIIDGTFGTKTKNAVIDYQKKNGLTQDGKAGSLTFAKLIAGLTVRNSTANMAARAAQYLLKKFEGSIVVDGIFGTKSVAAAKTFQSGMGITSDGIIGSVSWQYLFGYNAYPKPVGGTDTVYASVCTGVSNLTSAQMEANAKYIYRFLTGNGFTKQAACGVLGNMQHASYINPGIWQTLNNLSRGYGLVQWTPASKLVNWLVGKKVISAATAAAVNALATSNPKTLMDNELAFFIADCNNNAGGQAFFVPTKSMQHSEHSMTFAQYKASTLSASVLAVVFHDHYCRTAETLATIQSTRAKHATNWFNKL
jgi:hypothetical protein